MAGTLVGGAAMTRFGPEALFTPVALAVALLIVAIGASATLYRVSLETD